MSNHTPGPWNISDSHYWAVVDDEGDKVAHSFGNTRLSEQANANLIAAAPELLEALERIIADDRAAIDHDDYVFSKQAIAKAKGE